MAARFTRQIEIVASLLIRTVGALCAIALAAAAVGAYAQDLEPRPYSNTPVGLNFLIAGYSYAEGIIAFDPSLPVTDAQFYTNTEFVAYARSLGVWGKSAKFDVVVPYTSFSGHALVARQERQRVISGFNDPRFRTWQYRWGAGF